VTLNGHPDPKIWRAKALTLIVDNLVLINTKLSTTKTADPEISQMGQLFHF